METTPLQRKIVLLSQPVAKCPAISVRAKQRLVEKKKKEKRSKFTLAINVFVCQLSICKGFVWAHFVPITTSRQLACGWSGQRSPQGERISRSDDINKPPSTRALPCLGGEISHVLRSPILGSAQEVHADGASPSCQNQEERDEGIQAGSFPALPWNIIFQCLLILCRFQSLCTLLP